MDHRHQIDTASDAINRRHAVQIRQLTLDRDRDIDHAESFLAHAREQYLVITKRARARWQRRVDTAERDRELQIDRILAKHRG